MIKRCGNKLFQSSVCKGTNKHDQKVLQKCFFSNINIENNTKRQRYNVGVFGAGRIASTVHIPNILKNRRFDIKWIVDDNETQSAKVKNDLYLGDIPFLKSSDRKKLLADKSLDAVFIFTSTPTHAEYICESLGQGKSVMVEKPTGESYSDIKTCYEMAENSGGVLLTGFQRRFDAAFAEMWKSANNGSLGNLHLLKLTSRDCPKPSYEFLTNADRTGCNIISDLAVHDIDTMVWLTSCAEPESIYAITHIHDDHLKTIEEPDAVVLSIKFKNGLIATIDVVRESVYGYDIRIEIFGSQGMATAENPRRSSAVIDSSLGATMPPLHFSFPQRFEQAFETEIAHFCDCLSGLTSPLVTKEECLMVSRIVEKGIESYNIGQVVKF